MLIKILLLDESFSEIPTHVFLLFRNIILKIFLHSLTRRVSYNSCPRTDSQFTAEFCIARLQIQSNELILGQKPVKDLATEIQSFSIVHIPRDLGDKASNEIIHTDT